MFRRYPLADPVDSLSCAPLFIVGSGRTGTTLLRSMLVAGERIAIPPEIQVIRTAVRRYLSLQFIGWADLSRLIVALFESHNLFPLWDINLSPVYQTVINLSPQERSLARIIDEVLKCYAVQQFPKATMWGDQSPINTFYWPWISKTFPNAKYLHLLRDGRDTIASLIGRGLDLESATERWVTSISQCSALQEHVAADQFLEVRYETLVQETEQTLKLICEFLALAYDAQMLDFWKLPTTIEHKHQEYHRNLGRPVFTDSIGKWNQRLSPAEQAYVSSRTADLLEKFGYLGE
jgi:hypothetical protein